VRIKSESDAYYVNNNTNSLHNYNMIQPKHQLSHNVPAINQDYRNILSEKKLLAQPPQHLKT